MLSVAFGLDDMRAAYRVVPVLQPWFTVFAVWSFRQRRVEYYCLDGHNFGFGSAVLNFNAFAKLIVCFARSFFAVPCDQFFDDFMIVDLARARDSGQQCVGESLVLHGQRHEPSKRKPMAPANVGLGVMVDVSQAHTRLVAIAAVIPHRVSDVLSVLRAARTADWLEPSVASSVRGKLGFIFTSSYYRFGRVALQPFTQRAHFDSDYRFAQPLREAADFLEVVLPELPPLEMLLVRDVSPPLVVWTDAMFQWVDEVDPLHPFAPVRPLLRIGFVVIDPASGQRFFSYYELPLWYFTHFFASHMKTFIAQGEAVGALAPMLSLPWLFKGRAVIQFQDNTQALSALIHGYASKPDMGRVVNAYHLAQYGARARAWLEWVPSAANVADLPSRLMIEEMMWATISNLQSSNTRVAQHMRK